MNLLCNHCNTWSDDQPLAEVKDDILVSEIARTKCGGCGKYSLWLTSAPAWVNIDVSNLCIQDSGASVAQALSNETKELLAQSQ